MAYYPACKLETSSEATRFPHCTSHIGLEKGVGNGTARDAFHGLFIGGLLGALIGHYLETGYMALSYLE